MKVQEIYHFHKKLFQPNLCFVGANSLLVLFNKVTFGEHNLNWSILIPQQDEIPDIQQEIASTIDEEPLIEPEDFIIDVSSVLLLETLCITSDLRWWCTSWFLIHVTRDNLWLASPFPLYHSIAMWRACKRVNRLTFDATLLWLWYVAWDDF